MKIKILIISLGLLILSACNTSNETSDGVIQNKYKKQDGVVCWYEIIDVKEFSNWFYVPCTDEINKKITIK